MALMDRENRKMVGKLAVVAAGMFAFGYALVPIYKHVCEALGINVLALGEQQVPGGSSVYCWKQKHSILLKCAAALRGA